MNNLPKPGQYFETGSMIQNRYAGTPKLCVSVSKSRVYYRRVSDNPERQADIDASPPEYCDAKSVGIVCDTLAEMKEISSAAEVSYKKLNEAHMANLAEFRETLAAIRAKFNPPTTTP